MKLLLICEKQRFKAISKFSMPIRNIKHYSKALLDLGRQYDILDEILADIEDVAEKLNANLDLKKYLLDPQIKMSKKKQALKAVFQDFISEKTYNFLFILIKDKTIAYLDQIIGDVHKKRKDEEDVLEAIVESVVPVESKEEDIIKKTLAEKTNKRILIKNLIEPKLIGGLKITIGDMVIDSSVQGKLDRLRNIIRKLN